MIITKEMWERLIHRVQALEHQTQHQGIVSALHGISAQLTYMEKHIMPTLDEVLAAVTETDTKLDGITALITGLRQQVADVLASTNLSPAMQAKVDEIFAKATANNTEIDTALEANT